MYGVLSLTMSPHDVGYIENLVMQLRKKISKEAEE